MSSGMLDVLLEDDRAALLSGSCSDLGEVLEDESVDAIVTDPPAGIDFMGKGWDSDHGGRDNWIAWLTGLLIPSVKTLKPGGYALVWALPRTSHWTATAVEDAGLEIRDIHHHIFGTGFPKSLNLLKAFESKFGPEAATKLHEKLDGLGTALKPAVEHWILGRKPFEGTYAENFAEHGTGGLRIDDCRIEGAPEAPGTTPPTPNGNGNTLGAMTRSPFVTPSGRWPAHLSLDEFAAMILDEQSGELSSGDRRAGVRQGRRQGNTYGDQTGGGGPAIGSSSGGASRFFYVAKAPRSEKDAGLAHLQPTTGGEATDREDGSAGTMNPRAGAGRTGGARNFHPTVKSIALMRWLVRLITPSGGLVLDPFAGSGSTGVAALAEGCKFCGVELTSDYHPILVGRIQNALKEYPAP